MMKFETSKHVPKTEKRCFVFKNIYNTCAIKTICRIMVNLGPRSNVLSHVGKFICENYNFFQVFFHQI